MRSEFLRELADTQCLHAPLPLHPERALEAELAAKPALESRAVWDGLGCEAPRNAGPGSIEREETKDGAILRLRAPLRSGCWPPGAPADGDYSNFGTAAMCFGVADEDWRKYNRLSFLVRPDTPCLRILHLNVSVVNVGSRALPDRFFREGATVFSLQGNVWQRHVWEFASMPRDAIRELRFYVFLSGADLPAAKELVYEFADIRLERVAAPEREEGWACAPGRISISTAGYWPDGDKTAVAEPGIARFRVISADDGHTVLDGEAKQLENSLGRFSLLDFTPLSRQGRYKLLAGGAESPIFDIDRRLALEPVWKAVNFLFCERCGAPVPSRHASCHLDALAEHGGVRLSFAGGWHDAGDVSQQAAQTGEVAHALYEAAANATDAGLRRRLLEEAGWGLDFVLRTRFGDGYRATSAGATRFTDNLHGNMDDVRVRVHNHAFENFLLAGVQAYAAEVLRNEDLGLSLAALRAAEDDFAFAQAQFAASGIRRGSPFEHTHSSGLSQYHAVIAWSGARLQLAGAAGKYEAAAGEAAERLLACQETGGAGLPLSGFFYRDESHRTIVHYSHQSREQQFMQALASLCAAWPEHPMRHAWEAAMRRYGAYLKALMPYTAPYGMLPSGVHCVDEAGDSETFPLLHLMATHGEEAENYRAQLAAGAPVGSRHVIKRFPVWFSFRGNLAVQLAMGKAASLLGRYFGDGELIQIGREQLYWLWGKNPFCQSLQYGVGTRYAGQYAVLCGEAVGELPV
ncbi:MAG: glycoside hydrolase family 9 protein, partial [Clostridiales bacterium]|nr:glycoside hydrolase family 9 protein [Clostridiales bacterium]